MLEGGKLLGEAFIHLKVPSNPALSIISKPMWFWEIKRIIRLPWQTWFVLQLRCPWHGSSSSQNIPRFIAATWLPCDSYGELSFSCVEMKVITISFVSFIAIYTLLSARQTAADEWPLSWRPLNRSTWDSLRRDAYALSLQNTLLIHSFKLQCVDLELFLSIAFHLHGN